MWDLDYSQQVREVTSSQPLEEAAHLLRLQMPQTPSQNAISSLRKMPTSVTETARWPALWAKAICVQVSG